MPIVCIKPILSDSIKTPRIIANKGDNELKGVIILIGKFLIAKKASSQQKNVL